MAVSFDLVAKLRADTQDFITGLKSGEGATKSFNEQMMSMSKLVAVGAVAAFAVGGAALYKLGETFDSAFDDIRVSTGATGPALEALQEDMKAVAGAVPASFGDAGTAIAEFNKKLGLTGAPLQTLSAQVLELSRITDTDLKGNLAAVSQVMQNFGVDSAQQSSKLDLLFRASQASGLSVQELATSMSGAGVVLRELGFDFDQTVGFLASLKKAGVDASDVMPALSKTLASAAKNGKDANTVFNETFNAIKNAPDGVTASSAAMEVFGAKAGPKFAALIREGKISFEEMTASLANGGDTIMGASADTQDFAEKLTMLKNRVFLALEPIATKVFNKIGEVMDQLGPKVEQLAAWMTEHGDVMKIVAVVLGGALVIALAAYTAGMIAAAAATVAAGAPFIAIGVAIAALVAAAIYLWNNWDQVWNWVMEHKAYAAIILMLGSVIIVPIVALVAIIKWLQANWENVWAKIQTVTNFAWGIIKPIWDAIYSYIVDYLIPYMQFLWGVFQNVWNLISQKISEVWNNVIKPIWETIYGYIVDYLIPYYQLLWRVVSSVFTWIADKISETWDKIKPIWDAIYGYIVDYLIPWFKFLWDVVSEVWNQVTSKISTAWNFISSVFESIKGGISTLIGVFNTIKDGVTSAFSGVFDLIVNPIKDALNFIIDGWNGLEFEVPGFKIGPIGYDGFTLGLPDIPRFAKGGMVSDGLFSVGEEGPELGMKQGSSLRIFSNAASNRMMSIPNSEQSGGDVYVTVNGSNVSPQDVGREVLWALKVAG